MTNCKECGQEVNKVYDAFVELACLLTRVSNASHRMIDCDDIPLSVVDRYDYLMDIQNDVMHQLDLCRGAVAKHVPHELHDIENYGDEEMRTASEHEYADADNNTDKEITMNDIKVDTYSTYILNVHMAWDMAHCENTAFIANQLLLMKDNEIANYKASELRYREAIEMKDERIRDYARCTLSPDDVNDIDQYDIKNSMKGVIADINIVIDTMKAGIKAVEDGEYDYELMPTSMSELSSSYNALERMLADYRYEREFRVSATMDYSFVVTARNESEAEDAGREMVHDFTMDYTGSEDIDDIDWDNQGVDSVEDVD